MNPDLEPNIVQSKPEPTLSKFVDFARDIAAVCKKHGIQRFEAKFTPSVFDEWRTDIALHYDAGRHVINASRITLTSTQSISVEIK